MRFARTDRMPRMFLGLFVPFASFAPFVIKNIVPNKIYSLKENLP